MTQNVDGFIGLYKGGKGKLHLNYFASGNHEVLTTSEQVESRASALKNIRAMARLFSGTIPRVIDYTGKLPKDIVVKP